MREPQTLGTVRLNATLVLTMVGFSDLSSEIVLLVSKFIQPRDLDNFFQTSKRIRELNAGSIAEHKSLTRTYSHITYHPATALIPRIGTLAKLLRDVLTSPRIASYMENFDLQGYNTSWNTEEEQRKKDTLTEPNYSLFDKAFEGSKYIPSGEAAEWMESVELGAEDQFLGLLLTLLPNLSILDISGNCLWDWDTFLSDTIKRISQDLEPSALTMLTCVTLSSSHRQVPLYIVKYFAGLPSMKQIRAKDVFTTDEEKYASPEYSNVTSLSLKDCVVEPEPLYEFLRSFGSLVTFEYTDSTSVQGQLNSNLFWVCSLLDHHARHSLKKLTLRGPSGAILSPLRSFCGFEALEELDVDKCALVSSRKFGSRSLTEVLPKSIKKVVLRHPKPAASDCYTALVQDVVESKRRALPHLKALNFRPYNGQKPIQFSLGLIAACETAGITLTVD